MENQRRTLSSRKGRGGGEEILCNLTKNYLKKRRRGKSEDFFEHEITKDGEKCNRTEQFAYRLRKLSNKVSRLTKIRLSLARKKSAVTFVTRRYHRSVIDFAFEVFGIGDNVRIPRARECLASRREICTVNFGELDLPKRRQRRDARSRQFAAAFENLEAQKRVAYVTKVPPSFQVFAREANEAVECANLGIPAGVGVAAPFIYERRTRAYRTKRWPSANASEQRRRGVGSVGVGVGGGYPLSNCWNCCKREVLLSGEICRRPLEMPDRSRSDGAAHGSTEKLSPPRDFCSSSTDALPRVSRKANFVANLI